jgi:hypothetical protein
MSSETLGRRFGTVGARLKVAEKPWRGEPRIDIRRDGRGEYFDVRFAGGGRDVELEVVDVQPRDRHLLLLARIGEEKSKFLCGHDERHWFVAAVPEAARGVTGVLTAKAALQPSAVRALVERRRPKDPFRRRNAAYLRQGEWFFVPAAGIDPPAALVLRNEPLTRGAGNAHIMQYAHRRGGDVVYVSRRYPTGLSQARFERLPERERKRQSWQQFLRDPEVYAKGAVRHPDHATIHLPGWHRVFMNTEQGARAMRHVAFID